LTADSAKNIGIIDTIIRVIVSVARTIDFHSFFNKARLRLMANKNTSVATHLRFDRVELAGSFGDLGTLLPIVVAMILINKLSATTVFLGFGLFYLMTGLYYRLPVPVQPLKAVGAIAIAYPNQITESVIGAAGIIFGFLLLVMSLSGLLDRIARLFTQPVVRGIQLALGLVF
jgi:hypothetical protein